MADQELRYVLKVVDNATAELREIAGAMESLANTVSAMNDAMASSSSSVALAISSFAREVAVLGADFGALADALSSSRGQMEASERAAEQAAAAQTEHAAAVEQVTQAVEDVAEQTQEATESTRDMTVAARTAKVAEKELEQETESLGDQMAKLNQSVELVMKGLGLLKTAALFPIQQFQALFGAAEDLVRAYDQQAQAEVKLRVALAAQGDVTDDTRKSLIDYAGALQATTRYGDEAIVEVEALIASFVRGEENIKRATRAALDLSAALGTDLQSSAIKVAQAVETGELLIGRMRVNLTESEDPAKRLDAALGEIERRFGGLSTQLAGVGAGPLDQLQNAISDFQETIGELVSKTPEFLAFIDTSKELLASLQAFAKNNSSDLIVTFGRVFQTSLALAVVSIEAMVLGIEKLVRVVTSIGEFFGVFDTAEDVAKRIRFASDENAEFEKQLRHLTDLTPRVENLWGALLPGADEAANLAGELKVKIQENLRAIDELQGKANDLARDPFAEMKKGAGELAEELRGLIDQFDKGFERNLEARRGETPEAQRSRRAEGLERVTSQLEEAGLIGDLDPAVQAMKAAAERLEGATAEFASTAALAAQLRTQESFEFFEVLGEFNGSIDEWNELKALEREIVDQWQDAVEAMDLSADELSSSALELNLSANGLSFSAGSLNASASSLDASASALSDAGGDLSGASGSMDQAAQALQDAASSLANIQGGGDIPQLAAGGIVRRATKAIVGEAGPEAVIPLTDEGAAFAARAFGLQAPVAIGSVTVSARNLTLSDRGLDSVLAQFDRGLATSLARARRMRSGTLGRRGA